MKTRYLIIFIVLISFICSAAYAGECTISLRTVTKSGVGFTLYDDQNHLLPIDNGNLVPGAAGIYRTFMTQSDKLRLEYRVAVFSPTDPRPRLKVYTIPCGANVTIKK